MASFNLTPEQIAAAVGAKVANVQASWPVVKNSLDSLGIGSTYTYVGAIATIRVECPTFLPVHEYGGDAHLNKMYDTRTDLGNTPQLDGDGAKYCGRGFIQITGKNNYAHYGKEIGVDLITHPDAALEVNTAALIFALYFKERKVNEAADAGNWDLVRKKVNGGTNGLEPFKQYVAALQRSIK